MKRAPKHSARPIDASQQPISKSGSFVWDLKPKKGRDAYKSWLLTTFPRLTQLAMIFLPQHSSWEITLETEDLLALSLVESLMRFRSYAEALSGDDLNETIRSASAAAESISGDNSDRSLPHLLTNYVELFKTAKNDYHHLITTLFELLLEEIKSVAGDIEIDKEIAKLRKVRSSQLAALRAKKPAVQSFTEEDILFPFQMIASKLIVPFEPAGKLRGPQSIRKLTEISARCGGSHEKVFLRYLQENALGQRNAIKCTLEDWNKDCTTENLDGIGESRYGGLGMPKQILLKVFEANPNDDPIYLEITNGNGYVDYALEGNVYRIKQAKAIAYIDLLIDANKNREEGWLETPIHTTRDGTEYHGKEALNFIFMGKDKPNPSYKSGRLFAKYCLESDDDPPSDRIYRVRLCPKK